MDLGDTHGVGHRSIGHGLTSDRPSATLRICSIPPLPIRASAPVDAMCKRPGNPHVLTHLLYDLQPALWLACPVWRAVSGAVAPLAHTPERFAFVYNSLATGFCDLRLVSVPFRALLTCNFRICVILERAGCVPCRHATSVYLQTLCLIFFCWCDPLLALGRTASLVCCFT